MPLSLNCSVCLLVKFSLKARLFLHLTRYQPLAPALWVVLMLVNFDPFETVFLTSAFRLPLVLCLPRRGRSDVLQWGKFSVWSIVVLGIFRENILPAPASLLTDIHMDILSLFWNIHIF